MLTYLREVTTRAEPEELQQQAAEINHRTDQHSSNHEENENYSSKKSLN